MACMHLFLLDNAVDLVCLNGVHWSTHIRSPILYSIWSKSYFFKKFDVFFSFVQLFAIYKQLNV